MTEDPATSESVAGRDDEPVPAEREATGSNQNEIDERVRFLLKAPPAYSEWAAEQLSEFDPSGAIAARLAGEQPDPALSAAPPARFKAPLPWRGVVIGAALLAIVFGIYYMGLPKGEAPPAPTAVPTMGPGQQAMAVDESRVTELENRISADPADVDAMRELASIYFQAGDWPKSTTWLIRVVENDPADVDSRLMLGVTHFNVRNVAQAIVQWEEAAELDPENPLPYYNLGYAYLSKEPSDTEAAAAAWTRFLELDPESPSAGTVRMHLDQLADEG